MRQGIGNRKGKSKGNSFDAECAKEKPKGRGGACGMLTIGALV
jgi:hypothetical protein